MNEPKGEAMKKLSDGGPAFPDPAPREDGHLGMTLRDYFAAAAMQGLLANPTPDTGLKNWQSHFAGLAYQYADAMLAAKDCK